jgi:2,4-dienoyl-CoA reductase-like NADH-dependent reductase (Old Yellow Enzyme family)
MRLFSPIRIGSLEIPNRIVKSAMGEGMARDGHATEPLLDLYERWARGGTGLLISGIVTVAPGCQMVPGELGAFRDEHIASLRTLAERVHAAGGRIFAQLNHAPPQLIHKRANAVKQRSLSGGFNPVSWRYDRPLCSDEIEEIIVAFGQAAARVQAAGFDGIQLHAAHGYFLSRSISPRHNRRNDRWGGSARARACIIERTVAAVRDAVGSDYPLAIKINAHDRPRGSGLTVGQAIEIGRRCVEGGVDAIEVSAGTGDEAFGFYPIRGDIPIELSKKFLAKEMPFMRPIMPLVGPVLRYAAKSIAYDNKPYFVAEAARFARALPNTTIISVGGYRDPKAAEHVLQQTGVEMISLARPLLAEPSLPKRWQRGDTRAAACTSCNQCFVQVGLQQPLRCTGAGTLAPQ